MLRKNQPLYPLGIGRGRQGPLVRKEMLLVGKERPRVEPAIEVDLPEVARRIRENSLDEAIGGTDFEKHPENQQTSIHRAMDEVEFDWEASVGNQML